MRSCHSTITTLLTTLLAAGSFCFAQKRPATRPFEKFGQRLPRSTITFEMIPIPAGELTIPAATTRPATTIKIKRFWMGKTEVTWDELLHWVLALDVEDPMERKRATLARANPSQIRYGGLPHASGQAAFLVHHNTATGYCQWLSERTGRKYRLPTEAEWEWACGSGTGEAPRDQTTLLKYGWFMENATENLEPEDRKVYLEGWAHLVAKKLPNKYGLHDMFGNVAEWVVSNDGKGSPVTKGGSWRHRARIILEAGSSYRQPLLASWQARDPRDPKSRSWLSDAPHIGFRVACEE